MITTVNRWGNSLSIRIPKVFVKELNLKENISVDLNILDGVLIAKPVPAETRHRVEARFSAFQKFGKIMEDEPDFSEPAGEEVW